MKDKGYYFTAYSLGKLATFLPRKLALSLGEFLGELYFRAARNDRERACRQLGVSLAISDSRKNLMLTRRCFRNIGKNLIEFMRFPKLNSENINKLIRFEGIEHIDNARQNGKGVIILTAHFGNWELLAAGLSLSGYPFNAIVKQIKSQGLDKLVRHHREMVGAVCIDRDRSVRTALRSLKRNELLCILADIDTKTDGVFVDFFGRLAYTPYGAVAISLKTGAALIPTFIVRQDDDSHLIFIEPPLNLYRSGDWDTDLKINSSRFTKVIEGYIRRYPTQWIWMHRRWKTRPGDNRKSPFTL